MLRSPNTHRHVVYDNEHQNSNISCGHQHRSCESTSISHIRTPLSNISNGICNLSSYLSIIYIYFEFFICMVYLTYHMI